MNCKECKYWGEASEVGDNGAFMGQCHRHPPQVVIDDKEPMQYLPLTMEDGWCGEAKEAKK